MIDCFYKELYEISKLCGVITMLTYKMFSKITLNCFEHHLKCTITHIKLIHDTIFIIYELKQKHINQLIAYRV